MSFALWDGSLGIAVTPCAWVALPGYDGGYRILRARELTPMGTMAEVFFEMSDGRIYRSELPISKDSTGYRRVIIPS